MFNELELAHFWISELNSTFLFTLIELFGVAAHWVTDWINLELLEQWLPKNIKKNQSTGAQRAHYEQ